MVVSSLLCKCYCCLSLFFKKLYDFLFNFKKLNGRSDLFFVVKDKVFVVEYFDYEGRLYLIYINYKGKRVIFVKFLEVERFKL